jgi:HK97 gp10 family phage protein
MTMNLQMDGADQIAKMMKAFPDRIRRDIINAGAARGATVIKQRAKKNIKANGSVESGTLLKSIRTKKTKGMHGAYTIYVDDDAWYGHLVEFGHAGVALKSPVAFEMAAGQWKTIKRTGTAPAKPFMRPAMEENRQKLLEEISKRIAKRMSKEAEKMARQYGTLSKSYRKKLAK